MINLFRKYSLMALLAAATIVTGCKEDEVEPPEEHEGEIITDVKLIFTNTNDANDVVEARAQDPDGEGAQELQIIDEIDLGTDQTYELTFEIMNNLDEDHGEDIGEEVLEEADEHQIFFAFNEGAFASPVGTGNISGDSEINYKDSDSNGNPLGLKTEWTTASTESEGTFTVRLQHQPDVKTATSGANDGDTDFDLRFVLNIQ
ncbi:hypothetical protein [Xanthovirga aplysinae]|uniref:hypothetical protein n=1 Tax=Xanthovirga aplysinae TaxID=2529853 RepID=UPI001CA467FD|nr:hypothetical protein [Xanthovirga aplysinae]